MGKGTDNVLRLAFEERKKKQLYPPMQMAGSFGATAVLEGVLEEYFRLRVGDPWLLESVKLKVLRQAAACHFTHELSEDWEFDAYAATLYQTVTELKRLPIRTGLLMSSFPRGEMLVEFLLLLAHEDCVVFGDLLRFIAFKRGYTCEELCTHASLMTESGMTYGQMYDRLLALMRSAFRLLEAQTFSEEAVSEVLRLPAFLRLGVKDREMLHSYLLQVVLEVREHFTLSSDGFWMARYGWTRSIDGAEDEAEEMRRRFRSEAMNPAFLEGLASYGRRGAMSLAAYVARSCQWDFSCHGLDDWMYETMAQMNALRPDVQEWMRRVSPGALRHLTGSLLSAARKGRWHASLKTRTELLWLYRSLEAWPDKHQESAALQG